MNPVRTLLVALLALAPLALVAPAQAGGPTSVMISVPGTGRTASLYYTDGEYEELAELVGVLATGTPTETDVPTSGDAQVVTLTWLIHDVTPWRVDQVQVDHTGDVWISTHLADLTADQGGDIRESPVTWHRPDRPRRLLGLLHELGVGLDGTAGATTTSTDGGTEAGSGAEAPATATTSTVTTEDVAPAGQDESSVSLPSLGGGLLVGLAGGALLMALRLRRRPGAEPAPEPDVSGPSDRLAWRS